MIKKPPIVWTKAAERDLREIIDYIAVDGAEKAVDIYYSLRDHAEGLQELPARGRIVPELKHCGVSQYSELVISPWRIVYTLKEDEISVLAVIDSRRSTADILLDRLLD